jgi:hypothetical protein
MDTKENVMSLNFVFDSALDDTAKRLCYEYWSYASPSDYIAHLELLCYDHNTEINALFTALAECQVYLDDVHCEYCGRPYQLDVPADVPYARRLNSWFCEGCISFSGGQLVR